MSFTRTPIDQGRILDHHTLTNGATSKDQPASSSALKRSQSGFLIDANTDSDLINTLRNRSPSRSVTSSSQERLYIKPVSKEQTRSGYFAAPPKPTFEDTSVNIATAFHQAAFAEMPSNTVHRPKSSSIDKSSQLTNGHRQAPLSGKISRPSASINGSVAHVSDSEPEDDDMEDLDGKGRPVSKGSTSTGLRSTLQRALSPAAYYVRAPSKDPEESSQNLGLPRPPSRESSYDYTNEQAHYEELLMKAKNARRAASQEPTGETSIETSFENDSSLAKPVKKQRNRISVDNQAWKPGKGELDDDDDDGDSDGGKKRRRKKKKDDGAGRLTNLPVVGYGKKRKGRKSGGANPETIEEEADEESFGNETSEMQMDDHQLPSPPVEEAMESRDIPISQSQPISGAYAPVDLDAAQTRRRSRSRSVPREKSRASRRSFSIGSSLGTIAHHLGKAAISTLAFFWQAMTFLIKSPLGIIILLSAAIFSLYQTGVTVPLPKLPSLSMPSWPARSSYQAPSIPPSDLEGLVARLTQIENALEDVTHKYNTAQTRLEVEQKLTRQQSSRISTLEARLDGEVKRQIDTMETSRLVSNQAIQELRGGLSALRDQPHSAPPSHPVVDDKLAGTVSTLQLRVDLAESSLKDLTKQVKDVGSRPTHEVETPTGSSWINKLGLGHSSITIKSSDGQDVTSLIGQLVEDSVALHSKDTVGKADFALYSAGGRILPSLTSATLESRPSSWFRPLDYIPIVGRRPVKGLAPVHALHTDINVGRCWPFAGSEGQLGIVLADSVYISEFTIDHAPQELALNQRSAPREVEVWGFVEGKDNLEKLRVFRAERTALREKAVKLAAESGAEPPTPEPTFDGAPRGATYMHLASFTYDARKESNIQTFAVPPEIQDLGIDIGVVVFRFKKNWGSEDYTCVYRVRVHGKGMNQKTLIQKEELSDAAS